MNPVTPCLHLLRLAAIAVAGLAPGLAAQAAPVITVGAASTASANGVAGTTSNPSVPPDYAGSKSDATGASGSASSYGWARTGGAYAVSSSANGVGQSTAHAQFSYALLNDTGVGQNYSMNFLIYHGSIGAVGNNASLLAGESLSASYGARISVGGNTLFSTAANISRDSNGIHFSKSGTSLSNDTTADGVYSWNSGIYSLNLGFIAAGDTLSILAEVDDAAASLVGMGATATGGATQAGLDGGFDSSIVAGGGCFGGACAFYGDPALIGANNQPFETSVPASFVPQGLNVPEPGSLALAALALGLGATARRRKA